MNEKMFTNFPNQFLIVLQDKVHIYVIQWKFQAKNKLIQGRMEYINCVAFVGDVSKVYKQQSWPRAIG